MHSRAGLVFGLVVLTLCAPTSAEEIRVSGRVMASSETPLADAAVSLLPRTDRLVELQHPPERPAEPLRTRTDRKGRFELRAPAAGVWTVRVESPGFVAVEAALRPLLEPVVLESVELSPDVGVTVRVLSSDGTPVPGAAVVVSHEPPRFGQPRWRPARRSERTGEDGTIPLARGERESVTVSVQAPGHPVTKVPGQRGTAATVRLGKGVRRPFVIVGSDGSPIAGARVALGSALHAVGSSNEEGGVVLDLDARRPTELAVVTPDGRRLVTRITAARESEKAQRMQIPDRLSTVGRLIDAETRRPIAGGLAWDSERPDEVVVSDRDGAFVLSGAKGRRLELTGGAPGYLSADSFEIQLLDDGRPGPALALRPAAAIEGRVRTTDDEPVSGAEISLIPAAAPGRFRIEIGSNDPAPRALSGVDGRFRIGSIDPDNSYDLRAAAEGFASASRAVGDLEPYRTRGDLELVLSRGRVLIGRTVDEGGEPIAGTRIEAAASRKSGGSGMLQIVSGGGPKETILGTSDDDGSFELRGLPTGRFDLQLRRRGFAGRKLPAVEVPEGEEPVDVGEITLLPGERIEGYVRNRDGGPLEGVEVRLSESGAGMMTAFVGGAPQNEEPEAVTDPAGWFVVSDLGTEERYTLTFSRTGYVRTSSAGLELPRVEPLEVVLHPASTVSGRVLDSSGEPIAGARVELKRDKTIQMGGNVLRTIMMQNETTDHAGLYRFEDQEPGSIALSAIAAGYQEAQRDPVEIPEGEDLEGIDLPLPDGAILSGRVLSPDGRPALGATVQPVREETGGMPAVRMGGAGTDGNGYYQVEGLEPGALSIEATHPDYPRVVRDVELRVGRNSLDLQFEGGQAVAGRVVDDSGEGVPNAIVQLVPAGNVWGGPEARTEADGAFRIEGVQDGDYRLRAEADGLAPSPGDRPVRVAGQPIEGVEIVLDGGSAIFGRITGIEPERFADCDVSVQGSSPGSFGSSDVDYEGNYRVEHLAPGSYRVVARLRDAGKQTSEQTVLEPGGADMRLDLRFGGGLTLSGVARRGEEPVSGATVHAGGADVDSRGWGQTDFDGRFKIEGLEPGRYEIQLREFASGLAHDETIELATSREITLELPLTEVAGRVIDAADRNALAGVSIVLTAPEQAGRPSLPIHQAVTDLEGRFRIRSVPDGQWRLSATRKGYSAHTDSVSVRSERDVDDLEIAMQPTEGLVLEVRMPGGAAPDEVQAAVLDASGQRLLGGSYATGEGGSVRMASVPPGEWTLLISAAGAATTSLRLRAPGPKATVALQPACALRVEVPDLAGSATLATLRLRDANGAPYRSLSWMASPRSEWSVSGGRLELFALPPGSWTVSVSAADGRSWESPATTAPGLPASLVLD